VNSVTDGERAFSFSEPILWNSLQVKNTTSLQLRICTTSHIRKFFQKLLDPVGKNNIKKFWNGRPSRRKLKTWLHWTRPFVSLRWLAMNLHSLWSWSNLKRKLFTVCRAGWVTSIHCYINLSASEIQDISALKSFSFFWLASPFGHQSRENGSLYASSNCFYYLWVLAGLFDQGFKLNDKLACSQQITVK